MRLNKLANRRDATREGAPALKLTAEQTLRRAVLSCLLWENQFYEDGVAIADRIVALATDLPPSTVAAIAVEARERFHLRHVPLLLLTVLARTARGTDLLARTMERVIKRADEPAELLALYWRNGRRPIAKQLKKGLAEALTRFDAYELAKYDRDNPVKLRDVMFLVHAKPKDDAQAELWKQLASRTLPAPDTWEVALSAGADKKVTFERLMRGHKLGYLALLRNLRKMMESDVDVTLMTEAIAARRGAERVLPFRYVAAARACPALEPELDAALVAAIGDLPQLAGQTIVLVDVSGSMTAPLSRRSDLTRMDAAATLAAIVPGKVRVFTFSDDVVEVPPRRGMAGVDAVISSQVHNSTYLGKAVEQMSSLPHDRLIVISDEQSHDEVGMPRCRHAYMVNVASYRHAVGYGPWVRIDGFSEAILRFIHEHEAAV